MDDLIDTSKNKSSEEDNGRGCLWLILIAAIVWTCSKVENMNHKLDAIKYKIENTK